MIKILELSARVRGRLAKLTGSRGAYEQTAFRMMCLWTAAALTLALANQILVLGCYFDYPHAWVSAHFSVTARTFANVGILALHGVPIINNPPLGIQPEAYLHWPPLFSMALALVYRMFGASEAVSHGFMLVVFLVNTGLLGLLAKQCFGRIAGVIAVFGWLASPVTAQYGHLVWNLQLMLTFAFLSLLAFVKAKGGRRGWAIAGCISLGLAVMTSWEALLLCPGLIATSLWAGERWRIRLAVVYLAVGSLVCAAVLTHFVIQYPSQIAELIQKLTFRLGLSDQNVINQLLDARRRIPRPSFGSLLYVYLSRHLAYVGEIPLAAVGFLMVTAVGRFRHKEDTQAPHVLGALFSMWWVWFAVFWFHTYIHDFQMLLAVPAASIALGWAGSGLIRFLGRLECSQEQAPLKLTMLTVLPLILILSLPLALRDKRYFVAIDEAGHHWMVRRPGSEVLFGLDLRRSTSADAVIITPLESAVPLYYAQRHLVQGVQSETEVEKLQAVLGANFPGCPVYLGIPPEEQPAFSKLLLKYQTIARSPNLLLVDLKRSAGI